MKEKKINKKKSKLLSSIQASQYSLKNDQNKSTKSALYTKIELPILYSNLIIIEDMKIENSNYYLYTNGFLSNDIKIKSLKQDNNVNLSDCVFRIFPKTYNINKYKILDALKKEQKDKLYDEKINFKFESEIFNNLDIIHSKIGEPVKYGDVIMLMHENSNKFLKFDPIKKNLTLSNHDNELTLFQIEQYSDILINDNQCLKSGQPIRIKVASFHYANKNLYFSLHFPLFTNKTLYNNTNNSRISNINEINNLNLEKYNEYNNINCDDNLFQTPVLNNEQEHEQKKSLENSSEYYDELIDNNIYDKELKKYKNNPEISLEEESNMRWRFNLHSIFTTNEKLLLFGDFVNILHCHSNSYLTFKEINLSDDYDNYNLVENKENQNNLRHKINEEFSSDEDSDISLREEILIDENLDFSEVIIKEKKSILANFYLEKFIDIAETNSDINSTWILESIFPNMKQSSFIRYYESNKIDSYQMAFRIKNFRTSKYLSLKKLSSLEIDLFQKSNNGNEALNKISFLEGVKQSLYKFQLVDGISPDKINDKYITSSEYQNSLFGFQSNVKSNFPQHKRAEKNNFLRIIHISTKSYLKIVYMEKDTSRITSNYFNLNENYNVFGENIFNCVIILTPFIEEQDVFKIVPIDNLTIWKFKFLNSIKDLFNSVNYKLSQHVYYKTKIKYIEIKSIYFILNKLNEFITNQFINKFNPNYDYKSVCLERQNLLLKFGFIKIIMKDFIYNFWINNDLTNLIELKSIIIKLSENEDNFSLLNVSEKIIFKMSQITDSLFYFVTLLCKDNIENKNEVYNYLYVFMYFINIKESAVYCLIEVFKDNPIILNSLIKDCKTNLNYKNALSTIYKNFINFKNKEDSTLNYTIIDLILDYIKISKEKTRENNNFKLIIKYQKVMNTICLISRDKMFQLLKTLVYINSSSNILENQRYIIDKILYKDSEDKICLIDSLEKINEAAEYSPCLIELLVTLADENSDPLINSFVDTQFSFEKIFNGISDISLIFNKEQDSANLKLVSHFINALKNDVEDNSLFSNSLISNIIKRMSKFDYGLKVFKKDNTVFSKINFFDSDEVNAFISILQVLENIFIIDFDISHKDNIKDTLSKLKSKLISNLMLFIIIPFYNNRISSNFSGSMTDEFNKKEIILKDRISKNDFSNYLSISKNWLNVYLVYKNVISKISYEDKKDLTYKSFVSKKLSLKMNKNMRRNYKSNRLMSLKKVLINSRLKKSKKDMEDEDSDTYQVSISKLNRTKVNELKRQKTTNILAKTNVDKEKEILKEKIVKHSNFGNRLIPKLFKDKEFHRNEFIQDNKKNNKINSIDNDNDKNDLSNDSSNKSQRNKHDNNLNQYQSFMNPEHDDSNEISKDFYQATNDINKKNKNKVIFQIFSLFQMFLEKNINSMLKKFFKYFLFISKLLYDDEDINDLKENIVNKNPEESFQKFITYCVCPLSCTSDTLYYFKSFLKSEYELIKNNISKHNENIFDDFNDFNNLFVYQLKPQMSFIHNLMISFNLAETIDIQEQILYFIYQLFSQRKAFFEELMELDDIQLLIKTNKKLNKGVELSLEKLFTNFFNNYEKYKQVVSPDNLLQTSNEFLNNFLSEVMYLLQCFLNIIYEILTTTKFEYENENEKIILNIIKDITTKIKSINFDKDTSLFNEKMIDNLISLSIDLFNFINKYNKVSHISFISKLGKIKLLEKYSLSLIKNFTEKGKKILNINIDSQKDYILFKQIKHKYFICFYILFCIHGITVQQKESSIKFFLKLLKHNDDIFYRDSLITLMLLSYISCSQVTLLQLDYFLILDILKEFNFHSCIYIEQNYSIKGNKINDNNKDFNFNDNSLSGYNNKNSIGKYLVLNPSLKNSLHIGQFYLDILNSISSYVIDENKIISEANLNELIVENFLFFMENINKQYLKYDLIFRDFLQLISTLLNVDSVIKVITIKIIEYPLYLKYFPKPENLVYEFFSCFKNNDNLQNIKKGFNLFSYFIHYVLELNHHYLSTFDMKTYSLITKTYYTSHSKLIIFKILLYCLINDVHEFFNDSYLVEITMFLNEEFISNILQILDSKLYILLYLKAFNSINYGENTFETIPVYYDRFNYCFIKLFNKFKSNRNIADNINLSNKQLIEIDYYINDKLDFILQNSLQLKNIIPDIFLLTDFTLSVKEDLNLKFKEYFSKGIGKLRKFQSILISQKSKIEVLVNNETLSFVFNLLSLMETDSDHKHFNILNTFLYKIIEFVLKSSNLNPNINRQNFENTSNINKFILEILFKLISFFNDNEENCIYLKYKTLKEIQNSFERMGLIEKLLKLICLNSSIETSLQPYIFQLCCALLKKGNDNIQESFYKNFIKKSENELCFKYIYNLISFKIESIMTNKTLILNKLKLKQSIFNSESKFILFQDLNQQTDSKLMQFLQLLCENHNNKLQTYLRTQHNYRKKYDLINLTNQYLHVLFLNFDNHLFESIVKCFDLIIEFVQGPCWENQTSIINSKIMITLNDILNLYLRVDSIGNEMINYSDDLINFSDSNQSVLKMNPCQISVITYKTSILLLALIEARTKDDIIYEQIILSIKLDVIRNVYQKIFFQLASKLITTLDIGKVILRLRDMNKCDDVIDYCTDLNENELEEISINEYLIIETGFNLYFAEQYFKDYENNKKVEVFINKINSNSPESENGLIKIVNWACSESNIIYLVIIFLIDLMASTIALFIMFFSFLIYIFTLGKKNVYFDIIQKIRFKNFNTADCTKFYQNYSRSIEILNNQVVYKIYFLILPFIKYFKKFDKINFLENMDRTNSKTKLMDILKISSTLKYELISDYRIKRQLANIPIIGVIFKHITLWKDLSLFLSIVQNFFNLTSFYKEFNENGVLENKQDYFGLGPDDFVYFIRSIGAIQCFMASTILLEFFFRKTPPIISIIREELEILNLSYTKRKIYFTIEFIKRILLNFEVLYYIIYMVCSVLGLLYSQFYFAFLMTELMLRIKTLKNVLMSIKKPIKELILTFLLWFIIIYFFTIIAYAFLIDEFYSRDDCNSILKCFSTIFYQNNKNDIGIGGYLKPIVIDSDNKNPVPGRFWYDQIFFIITKVLIIQMIAGIIIDNFTKLRNEEMEMINDMDNICTICGQKRDDIEKLYEKYGKSYDYHLKYDHNIFNYIYYIIFLYFKDKTEFTGMESYIYDMVYKQKDITWFPFDKLYISKQEGETTI